MMPARTGAWLTCVTVSRNEVFVLAWPSFTETVMVVAPDQLLPGVIVTVRLLPEPPKIRLALGTRFVLEEVPDTCSDPAGVTGSPTTKPIGEVGTFSSVA